jgi:macrolide-specific efflux system membrane fusion protein
VTSVVESDVAAIEVGQEATVAVAALDASLRGRVIAIDPVASGSGSGGVVSFGVDVQLSAPSAGLRPGMSADITIVAASARNVLAIPSRALSGAAGTYTVRVVAADGSVSTRPVEVGLVTSSLAEVKSGLQTGELVVTGTSNSQNAANLGGGGAFPVGGGTIIRGNGVTP